MLSKACSLWSILTGFLFLFLRCVCLPPCCRTLRGLAADSCRKEGHFFINKRCDVIISRVSHTHEMKQVTRENTSCFSEAWAFLHGKIPSFESCVVTASKRHRERTNAIAPGLPHSNLSSLFQKRSHRIDILRLKFWFGPQGQTLVWQVWFGLPAHNPRSAKTITMSSCFVWNWHKKHTKYPELIKTRPGQFAIQTQWECNLACNIQHTTKDFLATLEIHLSSFQFYISKSFFLFVSFLLAVFSLVSSFLSLCGLCDSFTSYDIFLSLATLFLFSFFFPAFFSSELFSCSFLRPVSYCVRNPESAQVCLSFPANVFFPEWCPRSFTQCSVLLRSGQEWGYVTWCEFWEHFGDLRSLGWVLVLPTVKELQRNSDPRKDNSNLSPKQNIFLGVKINLTKMLCLDVSLS